MKTIIVEVYGALIYPYFVVKAIVEQLKKN